MKIALVTPFFPTREQPYRGHSAYQTILRLQRRAQVEVFCPLATYPKWWRPHNFPYSSTDLTYSPPEIKTHYFEYPALPGITRPINGEVCARYLQPKLRVRQIDLILNYWLYPEGYAAVRAGHKVGVPVVVRSIGSDLNRIPDRVTGWLTRRTMELADFVLTASTQLRNQAVSVGIPANKVRAILNGCDSTVFRPLDRDQVRILYDISPSVSVVLFVGRLESSKGVFELLRAARDLLHTGLNLLLVYVGEGTARALLESEVAALGMANQVRFTGVCDSVAIVQWLAAANLFALPSYAEGCPNVVLEALSCGRPIVASNVGALPELVDPRCGILIPPHNVEALADGMRTALQHTWDEAEIVRLHRRTWDDVADEIYEVCEAVVCHRRSCPA
jgi:glycosyltransferase involved in cell wall biosynthesis